MKIITIRGKKYRLTTRSYDSLIEVNGKGIIGGILLPEGMTMDSPNLRECVIKELLAYLERHRKASEMIQQRVKDGRAEFNRAGYLQPTPIMTPQENPVKPEQYLYIRAWGKMMRSDSAYVQRQQELAAEDGAPLDAVFRRENGWARLEEVNNAAQKFHAYLMGRAVAAECVAANHAEMMERLKDLCFGGSFCSCHKPPELCHCFKDTLAEIIRDYDTEKPC